MGAPTPTHEAFLGLLEPADLEALYAAGRLRRYRRGDLLMRQGDLATNVIVLLEGRVKVALLAQHELASLIGVSRNSVVRALTTLRTLRLIDTSSDVITIPDATALAEYVDD